MERKRTLKTLISSMISRPADEQIDRNKRSARAKKGWVTRRMQKQAEERKDTVQDVRVALRSFGRSINNPTHMARNFAIHKLIQKVRNLGGYHENHPRF